MSVEEFSKKMKSIQSAILEFLEDESVEVNKYENIVNLIVDQIILIKLV